MDVSIIIVNYNTKDLIKDCLDSVFQYTKDLDFEVIISDNGSTDGSVELIKNLFPKVHLIENKENLGFGGANNKGLKFATGKYILYLNSDTVLLNNAVKFFFDFFENHNQDGKLGAIGGYLLNQNGEEIHSGGQFPTYKNQEKYLFRRFLDSIGIRELLIKLKIFTPRSELQNLNIEYITGADLFLKNDENASFDENFFMYYEESDLQVKLKRKGLERKLIKGPKIIHLSGMSGGGRTSRYVFKKNTSIYSWISCLYYLKKNCTVGVSWKLMKIQLMLVYLLPWNFFSKTKGFKRIMEFK